MDNLMRDYHNNILFSVVMMILTVFRGLGSVVVVVMFLISEQ